MFLKATLQDGTDVVSEFSKLASPQKYANQVFGGLKPFNAWKVVGSTHPHSGERVLVRERVMYNGKLVMAITEVEPTTEQHDLLPSNFQPVSVMQKGGRGFYTVPEAAPQDDLVSGARYPIHRDPSTFRDYVVVRAAQEEGGEEGGTMVEVSEVRYYLDGRGENPAPAPSPFDYGTTQDYGDEDEEESDVESLPEEDDWDGEDA